MTQQEEQAIFAEVCLAALEFAFCKVVILQFKPQTKWSRVRSLIKTTAAPGFVFAEQVIDASLGHGNEDETPSVEVNFDALNSTVDENHTNGLYTEITKSVKSSLLTGSWTKLAAQACATMKQMVTGQIGPCDLAKFCSLLDVVIRRTIDVSMVELCNDCCLVLFLPNKTFNDVPCMVGISQIPEKLTELHSLRWELFLSLLHYFFDDMGMTISGLDLTHCVVKQHVIPWARKIVTDSTDASNVCALLAATDAPIQQTVWIQQFIKPLLQHVVEHNTLHNCCSSRMMHCINATSPPATKRRFEECKEEESTDDVVNVGQELALDVTSAPSTPPHADPAAWLSLTELNNNSGALLPPFQLHMLEMHLTVFMWELFHDSLSLEDTPDHDMTLCIHGKAANPVTCKLKNYLKLVFAGRVSHVRPSSGKHCSGLVPWPMLIYLWLATIICQLVPLQFHQLGWCQW